MTQLFVSQAENRCYGAADCKARGQWPCSLISWGREWGESKSCDTFDMLGGNPRIHVQYVNFQHMLTERLDVLDDGL